MNDISKVVRGLCWATVTLMVVYRSVEWLIGTEINPTHAVMAGVAAITMLLLDVHREVHT